MMATLFETAEAAPRTKPVPEAPAVTSGTVETYTTAPTETKAEPVKDVASAYQAAVKDLLDYKKAKRRNQDGDTAKLAGAVKAFGEIMLERPEAKVDYEAAAVLLLEADPSLASRTVVGLWKSTDGNPQFEPMVLRLHGVLTGDLKKLGIDAGKRPSDLAPKVVSDCKTRIEKIAAIAQLADDLKRIDEERNWRLLGADYTMVCGEGNLEDAYITYADYTETEHARDAALRVAEDALARLKAPSALAQAGSKPVGVSVAIWDPQYVQRAMAWYKKAGKDEAEIRAKLAPLSIEAEEAEQYAVAHEIYKALGDDVNRRRMELMLDDGKSGKLDFTEEE